MNPTDLLLGIVRAVMLAASVFGGGRGDGRGMDPAPSYQSVFARGGPDADMNYPYQPGDVRGDYNAAQKMHLGVDGRGARTPSPRPY